MIGVIYTILKIQMNLLLYLFLLDKVKSLKKQWKTLLKI